MQFIFPCVFARVLKFIQFNHLTGSCRLISRPHHCYVVDGIVAGVCGGALPQHIVENVFIDIDNAWMCGFQAVSVSVEEKNKWDLRMAVYAAMVYRMDKGVGQIVEQLKKTDAYDNTLILFNFLLIVVC